MGNSSPGETGVLTPFIQTYGLHISDKKEPEARQFELLKIIEEAVKNEYVYIEHFGIETYEEYSELIEKLYSTTNGCRMNAVKEQVLGE